MRGDPECRLNKSYLTEQQLTYFCGSAPECRQLGNSDALNVAKYNAERFYSVIGVTEHINATFFVLQFYLPKWVMAIPLMHSLDQAWSNSVKCTDETLYWPFSNRFFQGSFGEFKRLEQSKLTTWKKTKNKKQLTPDAKKILVRDLKLDIDFYNFCYQRLQQQVSRILGGLV